MAVERGSAQRGQTVRLRIRFEQSGTPADPDSIDSIRILDESLALVDTLNPADAVQDGVGLWHIDWAIPAAEPLELHHDEWVVTPLPGGSPKTFTLGFFVFDFSAMAAGSTYMTAAELAAYLPDATQLTTAEISAMGALAQEIVEACTGQRFLPFSEARTFDGLGKPVQPLDLPVVRDSVTKIEFLYDSTGWTDVTPTTATDVRYMRGRKMIGLGNVRSRSQGYRAAASSSYYWATSVGACGEFPIGLQNVRITASWGRWLIVPAQIKGAIGLLVRYAGSCNDDVGVPSNPFVSEDVPGGRSYTLRQILLAGAMVDRTTGYPDVDSILERFPRQPAISTVI